MGEFDHGLVGSAKEKPTDNWLNMTPIGFDHNYGVIIVNVGAVFSENVQAHTFWGDLFFHVKVPKCAARLSAHFFLAFQVRT